jgi:hypothetical protein
MSQFPTPAPATNLPRLLAAVALVIVAVVVAVFTLPTMVQAFRGPRTITEQELLSLGQPGGWDNYVRFKPSLAAVDTGLRYGKKGNEGTKYVLLPLAGRLLFCSVRVNDAGPEYVGQLGSFGGTEEEALRRLNVTAGKEVLPFMLQGVRSIWFDTALALIAIVGCVVGAIALVVRVLLSRRTLRSAA